MDNYRELKIRCDPGFGHLQIKTLYNKGCISTKEASFIVFDLYFICKSSLLYIMIMFKFSNKGTNYIYGPKLSTYQLFQNDF